MVMIVVGMVIMPVIRVSNRDHHLRIRRSGERREEQQEKQAQQIFLHTQSDGTQPARVVTKPRNLHPQSTANIWLPTTAAFLLPTPYSLPHCGTVSIAAVPSATVIV